MECSVADSSVKCEGLPTFRELPSSPSSGCAGGLVDVDSLEGRADAEHLVFALDFVFGGHIDGKVFLPLGRLH
jgi:hypothetical protein